MDWTQEQKAAALLDHKKVYELTDRIELLEKAVKVYLMKLGREIHEVELLTIQEGNVSYSSRQIQLEQLKNEKQLVLEVLGYQNETNMDN